MPISEAINYGDELARRTGVSEVSASLVRSDSTSQLGVTRLRSPSGLASPTQSVTPEKSLSISVHLKQPDSRHWATWVDGKFLPADSWAFGGVGLFDLESDPIAIRDSAFDCVHFNLPRTTLNAFTDQRELPRVRSLPVTQGAADPVLHHLAQMVVPSIGSTGHFSNLFWDQFVLILCTRISEAYATSSSRGASRCSGLAPWQKRRAMEYIEANLASDLRLEAIARECGLSASHFSRAFKISFGNSVHRYFTRLRVEKAKSLMRSSHHSLVEIALASGFPDQSGLCRTFAMFTGTSPAKWRRQNYSILPIARDAPSLELSLAL